VAPRAALVPELSGRLQTLPQLRKPLLDLRRKFHGVDRASQHTHYPQERPADKQDQRDGEPRDPDDRRQHDQCFKSDQRRQHTNDDGREPHQPYCSRLPLPALARRLDAAYQFSVAVLWAPRCHLYLFSSSSQRPVAGGALRSRDVSRRRR
jgi:hypothetical protein